MLLVVSIIYLFSYLGLSFLVAIGVLLIAFLYNFLLGWLDSKAWRIIMKRKDERMNATTETLNNIKMIKFYGWSKTFTDKIAKLRKSELSKLVWGMLTSCLISTGFHFFP